MEKNIQRASAGDSTILSQIVTRRHVLSENLSHTEHYITNFLFGTVLKNRLPQ